MQSALPLKVRKMPTDMHRIETIASTLQSSNRLGVVLLIRIIALARLQNHGSWKVEVISRPFFQIFEDQPVISKFVNEFGKNKLITFHNNNNIMHAHALIILLLVLLIHFRNK